MPHPRRKSTKATPVHGPAIRDRVGPHDAAHPEGFDLDAYWHELVNALPPPSPGGLPVAEVQAHLATLVEQFHAVMQAYHILHPRLDFTIYRVAIEECLRRLPRILYPWLLEAIDAAGATTTHKETPDV